jgi:hypothetical protein
MEKENLLKEFEAKPVLDEEVDVKSRHRHNLVNRLLNRYFGLVIILAVILFAAGGFYFLVMPKYNAILDSINTTVFSKNQLYPKYKELESYQNILRAYQAIDPAQIKRVDDMVPAEYVKEDLFTELVYIISKKGFVVNSLDIVKDTEGGAGAAGSPTSARVANDQASTAGSAGASGLPANIGQMSVKADISKVDYPGLKVVLNLMEDSLRLFDIKSLSFDPGSNNAVFQLTTYYSKSNN